MLSFCFCSCLESLVLGCREKHFPAFAVSLHRIVSHQILMSVRCPPPAPREHAQTRRAPSRVSHVNLVLRCLRTDSSVKVRLLAVFVQECAFVVPNRCVCLCVWLPPLEITRNAAANCIKWKRYDPESPPYLSPKSQNTSSRHHIIAGSWTPPPLAPFTPSLHNTMRHRSSNRKKWCQTDRLQIAQLKRQRCRHPVIIDWANYTQQAFFIWSQRWWFGLRCVYALCPDVDECMVANLCPGQLCLNSPGSYTCRSCGAGLRLSEGGYGCEGNLTTLTRTTA